MDRLFYKDKTNKSISNVNNLEEEITSFKHNCSLGDCNSISLSVEDRQVMDYLNLNVLYSLPLEVLEFFLENKSIPILNDIKWRYKLVSIDELTELYIYLYTIVVSDNIEKNRKRKYCW